MATGDIKNVYGSWAEATWSSNNQEGLADDTLTSAWSDEIDLSALIVIDVEVFLKYSVQTSLGTTPVIVLLAVGDANGNYPPVALENGRRVDSVVPNAAATVEYSSPVGLAAVFNGVLPAKFKFGLYNAAGNTLSATTDEVQVWYRRVYQQVEQ